MIPIGPHPTSAARQPGSAPTWSKSQEAPAAKILACRTRRCRPGSLEPSTWPGASVPSKPCDPAGVTEPSAMTGRSAARHLTVNIADRFAGPPSARCSRRRYRESSCKRPSQMPAWRDTLAVRSMTILLALLATRPWSSAARPIERIRRAPRTYSHDHALAGQPRDSTPGGCHACSGAPLGNLRGQVIRCAIPVFAR